MWNPRDDLVFAELCRSFDGLPLCKGGEKFSDTSRICHELCCAENRSLVSRGQFGLAQFTDIDLHAAHARVFQQVDVECKSRQTTRI